MDWGVALDMDVDMDVDMDMDTDIHIDLGAGRQAADTSGHCCPPSVSQSFGPCRLAAAARIPKGVNRAAACQQASMGPTRSLLQVSGKTETISEAYSEGSKPPNPKNEQDCSHRRVLAKTPLKTPGPELTRQAGVGTAPGRRRDGGRQAEAKTEPKPNQERPRGVKNEFQFWDHF